MAFYDEIKDYSLEDLELIIKTQKECYTPEEWDELIQLFAERGGNLEAIANAKAKGKAKDGSAIICPKCDSPNPPENRFCCFCGVPIRKEHEERKEREEKSYALHCILSFLIPLVGLVVGLVLLADKDGEKSAAGSLCVTISIISAILSGLALFAGWLAWF